jgi:hypothetical protein
MTRAILTPTATITAQISQNPASFLTTIVASTLTNSQKPTVSRVPTSTSQYLDDTTMVVPSPTSLFPTVSDHDTTTVASVVSRNPIDSGVRTSQYPTSFFGNTVTTASTVSENPTVPETASTRHPTSDHDGSAIVSVTESSQTTEQNGIYPASTFVLSWHAVNVLCLCIHQFYVSDM